MICLSSGIAVQYTKGELWKLSREYQMLTVTKAGGANESFLEGEQRNDGASSCFKSCSRLFHHSTKRFLSLQIHFFILKKRQIEQPCGFYPGIKVVVK